MTREPPSAQWTERTEPFCRIRVRVSRQNVPRRGRLAQTTRRHHSLFPPLFCSFHFPRDEGDIVSSSLFFSITFSPGRVLLRWATRVFSCTTKVRAKTPTFKGVDGGAVLFVGAHGVVSLSKRSVGATVRVLSTEKVRGHRAGDVRLGWTRRRGVKHTLCVHVRARLLAIA